jgi:alpha,alpha-trehalose-phosphate synthase [UDP-forming]
MDKRNSSALDRYDLVVVATGLPVDRFQASGGAVEWRRNLGGLVSALEPVMRNAAEIWVGSSGEDTIGPDPLEADGLRLLPVGLSAQEIHDFQEGFCNATLWPLYHDVIAPPQFHRVWWDAYIRVNQHFARTAAQCAAFGASVWIHDYQLQLVPEMLRALRPDLRIGFFNHIPFPGYEIFAQVPWRRQIVRGLLGADLLGFQRKSDATNFLRACRRAAGLTTSSAGRVRVPPSEAAMADPDTDPSAGRLVRTGRFPISIDAASFAELAGRADVQARAKAIRAALGNPKIVLLGIDRLDYTKGILHRLRAYAEVLADHQLSAPEAVLVQVASPSRERMEQYQQLRGEIEVTVGRINGDHSQLGRPAVHYLHQSYPKEELTALYLAADVMLVTSLRDGMNLEAKEYVACRRDDTGALVLSEFAGAADDLTQALLVNPHDIDGLKRTIVRATQISPAEARRRMRPMRRQVQQHDVAEWATSFLTALQSAPDRPQKAEDLDDAGLLTAAGGLRTAAPNGRPD